MTHDGVPSQHAGVELALEREADVHLFVSVLQLEDSALEFGGQNDGEDAEYAVFFRELCGSAHGFLVVRGTFQL